MTQVKEMPGDTISSQAMFDRMLGKLGASLYTFDGRFSRDNMGGIALKAIRFKAPHAPTGEWLAVVTAWQDQVEVVAFHKDASFVECVQGLMNRLNNGSLNWKVDEYAG